MARKSKAKPKPKLTDAERHKRFVDMAREVGRARNQAVRDLQRSVHESAALGRIRLGADRVELLGAETHGRERAERAKVIVVKHTLLLLDAVSGGHVLPERDVIILDEAHHLEEEATRLSGTETGTSPASRNAGPRR